MTGNMQNTVLIALIVVVAIFILYQYDSTLFGLLGRRYEGFAVPDDKQKGQQSTSELNQVKKEKFEDMGMNGCPEGQQKDIVGKCCSPGAMDEEGKCRSSEGFADLSSSKAPLTSAASSPPLVATLVTSSRPANSSPLTRHLSMLSKTLWGLAPSRARTS